MRPLAAIKPDYNFLMGYHTGVQKQWWYGIEGITSIFNEAWSDSEVGYNGYAINENDVTDYVYYSIKDKYEDDLADGIDCKNPDEMSSNEYEEYFAAYIAANADDIKSWLDDYIMAILENQKSENVV